MIICEELLFKYGGVYEIYDNNHIIFEEGQSAKYYFQIHKGIVEVNNFDESGKEFTQHILVKRKGIGESFIIGNVPYTVNAVTKSVCTVIKLPKYQFTKMLHENPEVSLAICKNIAERLSDNYYMMFVLISQDPESKVETMLQYLKSGSDKDEKYSYEIPITRQQIANLTGLRVETVIRTVKKLEKSNKIRIRNRKIFARFTRCLLFNYCI